MSETSGYVLGQSARAARRLEIQDAHFAQISELLLDDLQIGPQDRVVEFGCGPGGFSRRILRRLGPAGVLVGIDSSSGLLAEARAALAAAGTGRFEPVLADIAGLGPWLDGADVVTARTMLHHIPMVEFVLGRLRTRLRPGTRVGFIEPDFRSPLARLGYLEATGRADVAPLRTWAVAINQLYEANRLSPDVGATLGRALELAGYRRRARPLDRGTFGCVHGGEYADVLRRGARQASGAWHSERPGDRRATALAAGACAGHAAGRLGGLSGGV